MLDKRNVEQTRFKPANEPVETGFSLRILLNYYILLFVLIMLQVSEKTPCEVDFTPKNITNCVHNEPALWDTECTNGHHEINARINSYHSLSLLEAQYYMHHICVCLLYTV